MWNKLSLRIKITLLTATTLCLMCICMTVISVLNTEVFYDPMMSIIGKKPIDENEVTNQNDGIVDVNIAGELYIGSRNKFKELSIISAVVIVLVGTLLAYILANESLKSLTTFTDKIKAIDENNLNEQIALPSSRDEVAKLTQSFNHLLIKLDRAFDSKKLFAANAAHELKTPLTNILTNIEVLEMEAKPSVDEYRETIEITKNNVERLTVLVQDLLFFNTKLDESYFENIATDLLFEKILGDLSLSINEKNIRVSINGSITITGDKTLLERAFFNLVQNAVKYNKEGGEINIISQGCSIIIEDTGIGMPSESVEQIFDPFYCVDKSRSRQLGGNGLGLSIVKQILSNHGMEITVSSVLGKGTKIFIEV